jgi:Putative auto-transporter adhesin, head GIN domain
MKKLGIIVFIFALALGVVLSGAFSFGNYSFKMFSFSRGIQGSGDLKTEKRDLSDFKGVKVSGVFQVEITVQDNFEVQIEADDNLLEYIETEVDGDNLEISTNKRISSKNPLIVKIGAPNIDDIDASGAAKISISNLNNDVLKIDLSGATTLTAAGITKNLEIDLSGASRVDAANLKAENVTVESSGASKADVFASNLLDADLSGASGVTYSGSPKDLIKKVSGASCIKEN